MPEDRRRCPWRDELGYYPSPEYPTIPERRSAADKKVLDSPGLFRSGAVP